MTHQLRHIAADPHSQAYALLIPKCACTTIAQVLNYMASGSYFGGQWIHHPRPAIITARTPQEHRYLQERIREKGALGLACFRDPYSRVLSAYLDKVCSLQFDGQYYRAKLLMDFDETYHFAINDQVQGFQNFLEFLAAERADFQDAHFAPQSEILAQHLSEGGTITHYARTTTLAADLETWLDDCQPRFRPDLTQLPRFNAAQTPRQFPVESYFQTSRSQEIMTDLYGQDIEYSRDKTSLPLPD